MSQARIVIDTNILVAAVWGARSARNLLKACMEGELTWIASPAILNEYKSVILSFAAKKPFVKKLFNWLEDDEQVELVHPDERLNVVKECPPDNRFLEAAVAGDADVIVSSDKHLTQLDHYQHIQIVSAGWVLRNVLRD